VNINTIRTVCFLGIGGIGMSALARFFKAQGCAVSGYDKTPTPLTQKLIQEGIAVHFAEDISQIPKGIDLVVYTPAVPTTHAEYQYFLSHSIPIKKRAEILGMIASRYFSVAVAGTHGKTTITGLISHILFSSNIPVTAFIGGILKNYRSNLILSENAKVVVAEADEFDRSFLNLNPDMAVISAIDADHLDIYSDKKNLENSYHLFAGQIKQGGSLIYKCSLEMPELPGIKKYSYGLNDKADFYAKNIFLKDARFHFTACLLGTKIPVEIMTPGRHNIENAVAAAAVCHLYGLNPEQIKQGIETYEGVCRRFDIRIDKKSLVYIDDYAHHPEELKAFINAVKEMYPDKKITGIFQPHLFSRTRDFADDFASVLDKLDEAILLDIYPARETPIEGITSKLLLDKMTISNKRILTVSQLLDELKQNRKEVLLTMGAGDIDQLIEPIETILNGIYT